jgi:hypothetical protein
MGLLLPRFALPRALLIRLYFTVPLKERVLSH